MISIRKILLFFSVITTSIAYSQCEPIISSSTGSLAFCINETAFLDAGSPHDQYLWSNGETTQTIEIGLGGTYSVTVTETDGCIDSASVVMTQAPEIIPNVFASSQFVCLGDEVELSATGAGPSGTYEWSHSLGFGQTITFDVPATLTYQVTLTDVNNCSAIGSIHVTAIDIPTIDVSNDTTICEGASVILTVEGADNYRWFPTYGLSTDVGPSVLATPTHATDYTVVGYNELGGTECSDNKIIKVIIDTFEVALPLAKTVCKDEEVTVFVDVQGGIAPFIYTWTVNNVLRPENTSSIIDTVNIQSVYSLIVEDSHGCTASSTTTYVNYPPLEFEFHVNKESVCPKDPILFNATISGGTGAPYHFVFDGDYSNTIFTFYPKESHTYQLIARDGCEEIKDTLRITTFPIPYIDFVADEYSGCQPKTIKFTPVTIPSGLASKYKWNFGENNDNSLSLSSSPSHIFKKDGDFNVNLEILTVNGCFVDTLKEDLIHINPLPNLSFFAEPAIVSIYNPVVYFNNQSEGKDSLAYIWDFSTGDYSNFQSPNYRFPVVGEYFVKMEGRTMWGCTDTVVRKVEIMPEIEFYIPNAFTPDDDGINEIFKPATSNIIEKSYQFKVYSRTGFPLFETDELNEGWNGRQKNGDYVKPGVYVYHIIYRDIYEIKYEREGTVTVVY